MAYGRTVSGPGRCHAGTAVRQKGLCFGFAGLYIGGAEIVLRRRIMGSSLRMSEIIGVMEMECGFLEADEIEWAGVDVEECMLSIIFD